MTDSETIAIRVIVLVTAAAVAAILGYYLFVVIPGGSLATLLGVLLVIGAVVMAARGATRVADRLAPTYNVAEVAVEGPITRDGGAGPLPSSPRSTPADDIVEQIEAADEDDNAQALLVKLNTPGGEVVPSEDIRLAARDFQGPTVAYTTDMCASGGYWIATGCDELWARDASIVGSIGVILSQIKAHDMADRVGLTYEGFTAGEYKDAGQPLVELEDHQRNYFQQLTDGFYDKFVDRVAEVRGLSEDAVRDTEAKVYLGDDAHNIGLVDELGTREDIEAYLERKLGVEEVAVQAFEPHHRFTERLRMGAESLAFAFGAGLASVVDADGDWTFELR